MHQRFALLVLLAVLLAACTSDGTDTSADGSDDAVSTTVEASQENVTTSAPTETAETVQDDKQAGAAETEEVPGALPVSDEWEELKEKWFVWGVASDDSLNVRSAPGIEADVVTTIAHNEGDVTRFSEVVFVGETRWTPVAIPGGAGWVSLEFLRPTPSVTNPEISGDRTIGAATLEAVIEAMDSPAALAEFVGDDGLLVSPQQFIDEYTQLVSKADLQNNANQSRVWGSEPGSGEVIESSLADFLAASGGGPAFTSTEAIGFDTVISSGSAINNIASVFPEATTVEFLHTGTAYFGGLDWQSTTLVFNADEELVAIANGEWSP